LKGRTRVNHPPEVAVPADNRPLVAPIHQTVKFAFESLEETMRAYRGEREGYYYTRQANPTTRQLERLLAELQGRDDCVAVGSGIAAVAGCLLSLTRAGQHVLCFVETYTPSRQLIQGLLGRFGVAHTMLSIEDDAGIERVLAEKPTRLVWFESPTNPVTRIADIGRITRAAHAHGAEGIKRAIRAGEQIRDIVRNMSRITRLELSRQAPQLPPVLDLRKSSD